MGVVQYFISIEPETFYVAQKMLKQIELAYRAHQHTYSPFVFLFVVLVWPVVLVFNITANVYGFVSLHL